jgi:hypothetical protein
VPQTGEPTDRPLAAGFYGALSGNVRGMSMLLVILLVVVVLALVLGGFGYYRRGSQNTTIIED